jgi:hypothetical protein
MPHEYDFSKLNSTQQMEVHPKDWVEPLFVEYGMGIHGSTPAYFWRVKGTKHTFVIPVLRMNFLSSGDYEKHFSEALEIFRNDYIDWKNQGWITEWMQEYRKQFSGFISV